MIDETNGSPEADKLRDTISKASDLLHSDIHVPSSLDAAAVDRLLMSKPRWIGGFVAGDNDLRIEPRLTFAARIKYSNKIPLGKRIGEGHTSAFSFPDVVPSDPVVGAVFKPDGDRI